MNTEKKQREFFNGPSMSEYAVRKALRRKFGKRGYRWPHGEIHYRNSEGDWVFLCWSSEVARIIEREGW